MTCADVDGDGRDEIVVAVGNGFERVGVLAIYRWNGKSLDRTDVQETGAGAAGIFCADVEGEGRAQIFVAFCQPHRTLEIWRWKERLVRLGRWGATNLPEVFSPLGPTDHGLSDLLAQAIGKFDDAPGRQALYAASCWQHYRIYLVRPFEPGPPIAQTSARIRVGPDSLKVLDDGIVIAANCMPPDQLKALSRIEREENILPSGIYRLTVRHGAFEKIEPIDVEEEAAVGPLCAPRLGGARSLAYYVGRDGRWEWRLRRPHSGPAIRLGGYGGVLAADLEGTGKDQLLATSLVGGEVRLTCLGLGPAAKADLPLSVGPLPRESEGIEVRVGEDLLAFGMPEEAEIVFRAAGETPRALLGLGRALAEQRRWFDAAAVFRKAYLHPDAAGEASEGLVTALIALHDWPALNLALDDARSSIYVDGPRRARFDEWRAWAREAARMSPRLTVARWARETPFLAENPLFFRLTPEGRLEGRTTADWNPVAGLPFRTSGSPLRVEMEFTLDDLAWSADVRLGIKWPDASLYGDLGRSGSSGPHVTRVGLYDVRQGRIFSAAAPPDAVTLTHGASYRMTLEAIPGLGRCTLTLYESDTERCSLTAPFPVPPDAGTAVVGFSGDARTTVKTGVASRVTLSKVVVWGDESVALAPPEAKNARDRLFLANGHLVMGRLDDALREYQAAIAEGAAADRMEAHLFRAVAHLRRGARPEAEADAREALKLDRAGARAIIDSSRLAMDDGEARFFDGVADSDK